MRREGVLSSHGQIGRTCSQGRVRKWCSMGIDRMRSSLTLLLAGLDLIRGVARPQTDTDDPRWYSSHTVSVAYRAERSVALGVGAASVGRRAAGWWVVGGGSDAVVVRWSGGGGVAIHSPSLARLLRGNWRGTTRWLELLQRQKHIPVQILLDSYPFFNQCQSMSINSPSLSSIKC